MISCAVVGRVGSCACCRSSRCAPTFGAPVCSRCSEKRSAARSTGWFASAITGGVCESPMSLPRCATCVSSCSSSCRPSRLCGAYSPAPKTICRPTLYARAPTAAADSAAFWSRCTRTSRKLWSSRTLAPTSRASGSPGVRRVSPTSASGLRHAGRRGRSGSGRKDVGFFGAQVWPPMVVRVLHSARLTQAAPRPQPTRARRRPRASLYTSSDNAGAIS